MGILDFIFPKHCVSCKKLGDYICADCFSTISFNPYEICLVCNRGSIDGLTHPFCKTRYSIDGAFTSISYKGIVKRLIYQFKYKPFVADLQTILVGLFYEGLIQKELFFRTIEQLNNEAIVLVPIPLYKSKLRKRGYNQAQLLAKGLSKKLNISMIDMLVRVKNTSSQVGLDREKRRTNVSGAFSVIPASGSSASAGEANIFLIDDVLTTGSTLLEAANALKRKGAKKVWGIALARD